MKRLICEMCGGSDLVKQDGVFVCQNCGTKYSVEEAKNMMVEGAVTVEGTVAVEGTIKVDKSEELKKLYTLARRAKESDNTENAVRYYTQIELQDPDSWEAYFYLIYFKARVSKIGEIHKDCKNLSNCFSNTFDLLASSTHDDEEKIAALRMIITDIKLIGDIMGSSAKEISGLESLDYEASVLSMIECLGDSILKAFPELPEIAAEAWKTEIDIFISTMCWGEFSKDHYKFFTKGAYTGYVIDNVAKKIYDIDPTYEDPFGVAKKLRKNERFITCPKCGATMRERESKCPQCGTSKEEVQRLIAEKEAAEAAERERLRKEREAKEAEEARIRAEKRAEWWAANKKKVGIAILILIGIIVSIVAVKKISDAIAAKHAVAEAYEMIEQGKELVSTYHFDEAKDLYDQAYRMTMDNEVRKAVQEQNDELVKACQAAESEYNNALRRLQILLDADDNEFNDLSNACLDKMIEIHPEANTTQYFQNTFANHSLLTSIQNYEKQGNELYKQGQYEKAAKTYEAAIVVFEMEDKTPSVQLIQKKETAQQCATLLKKATTAEENDQYSEAATAYSELYTLHALASYDKKAKTLKEKSTAAQVIKSGVKDKDKDTKKNDGTKKIKDYAYRERDDIKTIAIPDGVVSIGQNAFCKCINLTSITIPNSVKEIDLFAFQSCTSLTSITIPNSVTWICQGTFRNCKSLSSVTLPNSIKGIGDEAFEGCSSLTSITIPNSVTWIGDWAFNGCTSLKSITIPNSIKGIPFYAFKDCTSLTSITIPNSVKEIGNEAFCGCTSLTSITIPNSVTWISNSAFDGCTKLNIKLPQKFKDKVDLSKCKSVTYY